MKTTTEGAASVVPHKSMHQLWDAFNDIAEGFGLNQDEMVEMLRVTLKDVLGYSEKKLDALSANLFTTLDDDRNQLVDALEFLSSLAVMSAMSVEQKVAFIFAVYDFDESGQLSVDETILAMRSTASGLCKLSGIDMPPETDIERIAVAAFAGVKILDGATIKRDTFVLYCASSPEVVAWLDSYADIPEEFFLTADVMGDKACEKNIALQAKVPERGLKQRAVLDLDGGAEALVAMEEEEEKVAQSRSSIKAPGESAAASSSKKKKKKGLPPWKTACSFLEPSVASKAEAAAEDPPEESLLLEWVYGFNARRRQNVWYTPRGELVYSAGALGVVYDAANHAQRFVNAHTDVVECVRVHRAARETLVATGQLGARPKIVVWSALTMEVLATLRGVHAMGVMHVDFCRGGGGGGGDDDGDDDPELLVSVGAPAGALEDGPAKQIVAVYAWRTQRLLYTGAVSAAELILDVRFISPKHFATCGVDHVHFWWANEVVAVKNNDHAGGLGYRHERGLFCKKVPKQPMLTVCAMAGGTVVTGAASGHLLVWAGRTCVEAHKNHASAITCVQPMGAGTSSTSTSEHEAAHKAASSESKVRSLLGGGAVDPADRHKPGLLTGSTDGKVLIWSRALEVTHTFDMKTLGGLSAAVHSVCFEPHLQKILVATSAAEIFEISAEDGRPLLPGQQQDGEGGGGAGGGLVCGHAERRLTAVATHPEDPTTAVTVGDDKVLYVWELQRKKRAVRHCTLDTMARCCAFNGDGTVLAVGLGGVDHQGQKQRKDGAYCIVDFETLTVVHEARDSKLPIAAIAFSPDGLTLALGSEDRCLYLYNVGDYASTAKCRGHKGRVTQLDWSEDSKLLQSTDDVGELLFWEADSGLQRAPRLMRDVQWATHRCTYGHPLRGTWDPEAMDDGSFLACCARIPTEAPHLVAATDNYGRVRLWRYPVPSVKCQALDAAVGGPPGGACVWSCDARRLLSTSRGDGTLVQWLLGPRDHVVPPENARTLDPGDEANPRRIERLDADDAKVGPDFRRDAQLEKAARRDQTALFAMEERGWDEDYQPLRPWQRTIVAPSRPPDEDLSKPTDRLRLEYVHGYRCHDAKNLARYHHSSTAAGRGDMLFGAAKLVVKLDPTTRTQTFYRDHGGEVVSMATHAGRPALVATGEIADFPSVHVWDAASMGTLAVLRGHHRRAVLALAFSADDRAKHLISIGADDVHTCCVFAWATQTVVARFATRRDRPLCLLPNRNGAGFACGPHGFVTCGANFVRFYDYEGKNGWSNYARIGNKGKLQPFLAMAWLGSTLAVATLDGAIYRFVGRQLDSVKVKVHGGAAVNVMLATNEGLLTGGRDGVVKFWSLALDGVKWECDVGFLGAAATGPTQAIRALDWDADLQRVLVGTLAADLFEVDAASGESVVVTGQNPTQQQVGALQTGHFGGAVGGLSAHPALPQFCTVGDDEFLRVWSLLDKRQVRCSKLEMRSRACAFSPDGTMIAVGLGAPPTPPTTTTTTTTDGTHKKKIFDGKFIIVDSDDFSVIHETRDSHKHITEIKYSPDGTSLAVGSWDTRIYVYTFEEGRQLRLLNMITQHNSAIHHLDFSAGSTGGGGGTTKAKATYLQANCGASELCFFEADTGMYIPAASRLRDVRWSTLTCCLSWASQGVHAAQADGSVVTSMDTTALAAAQPAIATGDNFGRVRLWRYPCTASAAKCKDFQAHSAAVARVRWCGQGSHLVTTSLHDRIVMQWTHEVDELAQEEADQSRRKTTTSTTGGTQHEAEGDGAKASEAFDEDEEEHDEDHPVQGTAAVSLADRLDDDRVGRTTHDEDEDEDAANEKEAREALSRPWLLAAVAPSNVAAPDRSEPEVSLELDWVHGCEADRAKSALVYTPAGDVIAPASRVAVVYSKAAHAQRFYRGHAEAIAAVAISRDGRFVASGERARRPRIDVWEPNACATVVKLPPFHRGAVASLAFSPLGDGLLSVGADADGSIAYWRSVSGEWHDACLVATAQGGASPVRFAIFANYSKLPSPTIFDDDDGEEEEEEGEPTTTMSSSIIEGKKKKPAEEGQLARLRGRSDTAGGRSKVQQHPPPQQQPRDKYDGFEMCSGGDAHVYFWEREGGDLVATEALWQGKRSRSRAEAVTCGAAVLDRFVTGTSLGHLCVWRGRTCERSIRAHDLAVETVHACGLVYRGGHTTTSSPHAEQMFATGSRDGWVKLWNSRFQQVRAYDVVDAPLRPLMRRVTSVHVGTAPDGAAAKILVGTQSAEVLEVATESGSWTLLAEAPCHRDELWVLAAHPTDPQVFLTAGDDGTIRIWSVALHSVLRKALFDGPIRAAAWSPDGARILVGMGGSSDGTRHKKDGVFCVLDAATLAVLHEGRDSRHAIRCVKYAPDARSFAIASSDHKVYLYDAASTALRARCEKHTAHVTHMDFTADSQYLQTDTADFEHHFSAVADGSRVRLPSQLKDAHFDGWSCIYGWPVQGCWPAFSGDASRDVRVDLTTTHRSADEKVIAAGDQAGALRLYRFPAHQKALPVTCAHSHVGHVAKVAFSADDSFLVSAGKNDRTIAIWKVTKPNADEKNGSPRPFLKGDKRT